MSTTDKFPVSKMCAQPLNGMNAVYMRTSQCKDKTPLKMSIGDPTFDGNLVAPDTATKALDATVDIPTTYSYQPSMGRADARAAVAEYMGRRFAGSNHDACKADHVVITSGGAEAVLHAILALCNPGDNLLTPAPGFTLYGYACDTYGIEDRPYHMTLDTNWEIDLDEVRRLVDDRTRAILINNPSNPCGNSWSRGHVEAILKVAEELCLPVISDEIYAGMVFSGQQFTSVAEFDTPVPRFICNGAAKSFMAPGWRCGWILLVDRDGIGQSVLEGIHNLTTMSLGCNAHTQSALPQMLANTTDDYFDANMHEIENNALYFAEGINTKCKGLSCNTPQGALYVMVKIDLDAFDTFEADRDFYLALEDEENIQVIPGSAMGAPGYFRACITRPANIIEEVMERLTQFCNRHATKK